MNDNERLTIPLAGPSDDERVDWTAGDQFKDGDQRMGLYEKSWGWRLGGD